MSNPCSVDKIYMGAGMVQGIPGVEILEEKNRRLINIGATIRVRYRALYTEHHPLNNAPISTISLTARTKVTVDATRQEAVDSDPSIEVISTSTRSQRRDRTRFHRYCRLYTTDSPGSERAFVPPTAVPTMRYGPTFSRIVNPNTRPLGTF